jgi:hypothetical protein
MDIIEEIYSDIKLLLVEIRDVNTTYNNELYKDIEEIDELISNKYNIDKESFNGIIESSFYTLFSYEKIISYIDSIIEKIKNKNDLTSSESTVFVKRKMLSRLIKTKANMEDDIIRILNAFVPEIFLLYDKQETKKFEQLQFLNNIFKKYPCISMYSYITDSFLGKITNNVEIIKLNKMIEDIKDYILQEEINKKTTKYDFLIKEKNSLFLSNPPLKRYGLYPATKSMPIENLAHIIFNNTKYKSLDDFMGDSENGVIILMHITKNPVNYEISDLFKKSEDVISLDYGPTVKLSEKFKIIKVLSDKRWYYGFSSNNINAKSFYIIETIDGSNYRCLSLWYNPTKYDIPIYKLERFINYLKNGAENDRISNYQTLSMVDCAKNMFLETQFNLESMGKKSVENVDIITIRHDIKNKLISALNSLIEKEYNNNIQNQIELNDLLHNLIIKQVYSESLIFYIEKYVEYQSDDFKELFLAFLVELESSSNLFMKIIHDNYNRNLLSDKVFNLDKTKKMNTINDRIKKIVEDSLALGLRTDENVFSGLIFKQYLLTFI